MTSLHDLQTQLLDGVLDPAAKGAIALIDAPASIAAARLAVYRNTVRSNVTEALHATYPAVWRLVGADYFRQMAGDFGARQPSRCGDLLIMSDRFPDYVDQLHRHDDYRYLGDVARLELMIQEALLAAEHSPFDLERLARVAPGDYDNLKFVLHPSLRLFESRYPIQKIWDSNVGRDAEPEVIDLDAGGDRLAVLRHRLQLQFHPLSIGEWVWLSALGRGCTFAASIEAAAAGAPEFDPTAALQRFVALQAIVDFQ